MSTLVRRNLTKIIFISFALILALPIHWGILTGLAYWFSPFLMLNSVFVLKTLVILNVIGLIILPIFWFRKRWFCNYLCPLGYCLNKMPEYKRIKSKIAVSKFPDINKWLAIISLSGALFELPVFIFLDPIFILNGFTGLFFRSFNYGLFILGSFFPLLLLLQLFIPRLWCEKLCPLGGLQMIIFDIKKTISGSTRQHKFDAGRRLFIGGALGTISAIILPSVIDPDYEIVMRPPGSVNNFNTLCLRCGNCIKACPSQILKQNTKIGFGLLTPVIRFNKSYCLENCNLCSVVCPSGSITLFSIEAKKSLKIGHVEINADKCLLAIPKECGVCKPACPYKAIEIDYESDNSLQVQLTINEDRCNGCGACASICPENCFIIKPLQE